MTVKDATWSLGFAHHSPKPAKTQYKGKENISLLHSVPVFSVSFPFAFLFIVFQSAAI
jgi:hypothetical protein